VKFDCVSTQQDEIDKWLKAHAITVFICVICVHEVAVFFNQSVDIVNSVLMF